MSGRAARRAPISFTPYPADLMRAYPVDRRVGNVKNNDAKLLEELRA